MRTSRLLGLVIVFSLAGIADSLYLAQHALTNTALSCGIEAISGCNTVAQSQYSQFFGIPLGVYGVIFYTLVFFGAIIARRSSTKRIIQALFGLGVIGMLFSLYSVWLQLFVINAICIYCMGSFVLALGIFVSTSLLLRTRHEPPNVVV